MRRHDAHSSAAARVLPAALLVAALATTPGCLLLFAEPNCPGERIDSVGNVTIGAEPFTPVADSFDVTTGTGASCVTGVEIDVDFGRDCSLWVQADGVGDRKDVYALTFYGVDGCGIDGSLSLLDVGESAVVVNGSLTPVPDDDMSCFGGTLVVELDALFEVDGAETVEVVGTIEVDGVENAYEDDRPCR